MKVLLASSEVVPFAKTGGLADVSGALPVELQKQGAEVAVFMPAYRAIYGCGQPVEETGIHFQIPIGSKMVAGSLLKSRLPDSNVTVYLARQDEYFDRDSLYQINGEDYKDNCERFAFFCRFLVDALGQLDWYPDLIHCNDWQTGLIPAYLKTLYAGDPKLEHIATLMTIHNLAYQGNFWHWDMLLTGIDWQYFNWRQMEFYGRLNLLKTGLVFADALSTVSPTYALEIQTPAQGCGLENVLQERAEDLTGVLNGIDTSVWNPQTDPCLAANYNVENWRTEKPECKTDLQQIMGLKVDPDVPLIGIVGRIASQKGWSLIIEVMEKWLTGGINVQWAILGTGDATYQRSLSHLSHRAPDSIGVRLEFSDKLAHKIEAGADIFLMPSQYEPCGLNQQYSMQYGTVPVIHETGGLADTVINLDESTLSNQSANGFSFSGYHTRAMEEALTRAIQMYTLPNTWGQLVENGMNHNWSWAVSAAEYMKLYQATISNRKPRHQPA